MKLTILGSGSVKSAPVYGCSCHVCQRARSNDEYRRGPASARIEVDGFRLLLDAGLPDLRERFPEGQLTHILITHYHMDHVQGLFSLRWGENLTIEVIGPDDTKGCDDLFKHPGILDFSRKTQPFEPFELGPMRITPLPMNHSKLTHGYFIEHNATKIAYLTDTCGLKKEVTEFLLARKLDLMIIDCTSPPQSVKPNSHNDLNLAIEVHQNIEPKKTLLTHLSHKMDAWLDEHTDKLPENVGVARDNLILNF